MIEGAATSGGAAERRVHALRQLARRWLGSPPVSGGLAAPPAVQPGREGPGRIPGVGVRAPVGWGPSRRGHPLGGRHGGPLGGDAGQLPAADAATGGGRDRGHGPVAIRDASAAGPLLSRAGGAGPAPAAVGRRPGATVRLPGVRALVAGAAAHAMMPLNVPPAGGVGLRRVSGSVSAGEQITYPGAARTASQTAGTCAQIGSARGRRQTPPRSVIAG